MLTPHVDQRSAWVTSIEFVVAQNSIHRNLGDELQVLYEDDLIFGQPGVGADVFEGLFDDSTTTSQDLSDHGVVERPYAAVL